MSSPVSRQSADEAGVLWLQRPSFVGASRLRGRGFREQADAHILRLVDDLAVDLHEAVGDADHQPAHDHALEFDVVGELLGGRQRPCR